MTEYWQEVRFVSWFTFITSTIGTIIYVIYKTWQAGRKIDAYELIIDNEEEEYDPGN